MTIICSNCGKEIPAAGRICPYCHVDKTADVKRQQTTTALGCLGLIVITLVLACLKTYWWDKK